MPEKIAKNIDRFAEYLVAAIFASMLLAGGLQVFNRFVLNHSLSWSEEFQKFAHIWLIFLTIPVAYNRGSHIGMQILFGRLPQRVRKILEIFFDLIWLSLAVAILYNSSIIMTVAKNQTSAGLGVRMDIVYSGLMIGSGYLAFIAVRRLLSYRTVRQIRTEGDAPC